MLPDLPGIVLTVPASGSQASGGKVNQVGAGYLTAGNVRFGFSASAVVDISRKEPATDPEPLASAGIGWLEVPELLATVLTTTISAAQTAVLSTSGSVNRSAESVFSSITGEPAAVTISNGRLTQTATQPQTRGVAALNSQTVDAVLADWSL